MFGSVTPVFNEEDLLPGFLDLMNVDVRVIVISDKTYQGNSLAHDKSEEIALEKGAIIIRTTTSNQIEMRNLGLALLQGLGVQYAFIADVDEWYPTQTLENYKKFIEENPENAYIAKMQSIFRRPNWAVTAPNDGGSLVALKTDQRLFAIRMFPIMRRIPEDLGTILHFSYCRTPEKVKEKIQNFSHASEVIPTWYENVFLPCHPQSETDEFGTKNVHPTVPEAWPELKVIELPEEIKSKIPQKLWSA